MITRRNSRDAKLNANITYASYTICLIHLLSVIFSFQIFNIIKVRTNNLQKPKYAPQLYYGITQKLPESWSKCEQSNIWNTARSTRLNSTLHAHLIRSEIQQ